MRRPRSLLALGASVALLAAGLAAWAAVGSAPLAPSAAAGLRGPAAASDSPEGPATALAAPAPAADGSGSTAPTGPPEGALPPDLDVTAPGGLVVHALGLPLERQFRLGFVSAAANVGAGPLLVRGSRADTAQPEMVAEQVVTLAGGRGTAVRPGVGRFAYVEEDTHEHWHLLPFMVYELRRARDFSLVVPDGKSGFCLGDRYEVDPASVLPGEPENPVWATNCGPAEPELLSIEEGISVGFGDVYEAWRDQQYLVLTGVPAGRYLLVHRVNRGRPLLESNYQNNASSALIQLSWPRGEHRKPRVRVLRLCPDSARCRLPRTR